MESIVLFGDSLLGRFGKRCIDKVEKEVEKIIIYNCAAGGWDTHDGVRRAKFISRLNPDYVILSFGGNDAAPWKNQIPLENFKTNLNSIIDFFKKSRIIIFPCPPANNPNEPKETKEFNQSLDRYNKVIKKIAKNKKIQIINSNKVYGDLLKVNKNYHEEDGIHLNDYGYNLLIKEIVRIIE